MGNGDDRSSAGWGCEKGIGVCKNYERARRTEGGYGVG